MKDAYQRPVMMDDEQHTISRPSSTLETRGSRPIAYKKNSSDDTHFKGRASLMRPGLSSPSGSLAAARLGGIARGSTALCPGRISVSGSLGTPSSTRSSNRAL